MSNVTYNIDHYLCSDKGLLLPAINEYTWNTYIRAVLYLVAMLWCFFGVALVSEAFMCSIDHITSKTIYLPGPQGDGFNLIEVKVWNETVANLTLLAFGTSAPEILLNVIETCGHSFKAGELGPGTIVGSAAFNMFFITAFAVGCIPAGQTRRVKHLGVFAVTSIFGIWAYVWLILVVLVITPKVVEIWEAVLTLLMFPLLIVISYLADIGFVCDKQVGITADLEIGLDLDNNEKIDSVEFLELARKLAKELGMNEDDVAKTMATHISKKHRRTSIWYRVQATRLITGGAKLEPPRSSVEDANLKMLQEIVAEPRRLPVGGTESKDGGKELRLSASSEQNLLHLKKSMVEFAAATCTVLENEGQVRVGIRRHGDLSKTITIGVETIDGTAEAGGDYIAMKQLLTFEPGETLKYVSIEIVDDDIWEPDEFFFVKLFHHPEGSSTEEVVIGKLAINQVTIVDDDEPGTLEFSKPSYIVKESASAARLVVNRVNGADGEVTVKWVTKDMTARNRDEYEGGEGVVTFSHGETSKIIAIQINGIMQKDQEPNFQVELSSATGGALLGKITKTVVTIINDEEFHNMLTRIASKTKKNLDGLKLDTSTWAEQFRSAMIINGGDVQDATCLDYTLHFITFFWKVLAAFLPPPSMGGGWPTFISSLVTVGLLTAIVSDLASIFGCLVGLSDYITAITFVALGTSMPDLFASKCAAINEKWADSSIGNINGSNSVNVFLGLGLPWLLASIYWKIKGKEFVHPTGTVGMSVTVFTVCAVFTIVMLVVRRYMTIFGKAELGGPKTPKYLTCLLGLAFWVIYVLVSSMQAQGVLHAF